MSKTDKTARNRQARRRARLAKIARQAGYKSWYAYETAVLNKRIEILRNDK